MATSFKKNTKVKLGVLTDIDMLLIGRKRCKRRHVSLYQYSKVNNKYMKDCNKNKESLYLQYWDVNYLYGWQCHKSF